MKNNNLYIFLALFATVLFSCNTRQKELSIGAGEADFSRYVAVGNSLTAGYQDGALYKEGQMNSYPSLLAQQFSLAGGGAFNIPYLDSGAGNDGSGNPRRILAYTIPCNSTIPALSPILDPAGAVALNNVSAKGPYNLVGAPGARAIDCNFGLYSLVNPYLNRFCQSPGTSTLVTEALRLNPTFFSFWLGSNDALLYATGGGVAPSGILDPAVLSDPAAVAQNIQSALDTLTANGAKGVVANVPDVTVIPYFTTIPWNGVVLDTLQAAALNAAFTGTGLAPWKVGANGFLIEDSTATNYIRHATEGDLILLSTPKDSISCAGWGTSKPLTDKYVLDVVEKTNVQTHISQYNASIASIAVQKNLAFVDINKFLKSFTSGIIYNGIQMNAQYITGGAFSLDGVHPNQRGYALIANEFIKAINSKYKSSIPYVDPTRYHGIIFP